MVCIVGKWQACSKRVSLILQARVQGSWESQAHPASGECTLVCGQQPFEQTSGSLAAPGCSSCSAQAGRQTGIPSRALAAELRGTWEVRVSAGLKLQVVRTSLERISWGRYLTAQPAGKQTPYFAHSGRGETLRDCFIPGCGRRRVGAWQFLTCSLP